MKSILFLFLLLFLFSCQKNGTVTETPAANAPLDSAQIIYVTATPGGSNFSTLYAYGNNGQKRWELVNVRPFFTQQAYKDNSLYMAAEGKMYCWNAETGAVKWAYNSGVYLVQPKLQGDTLITAATTIAPSSANELILLNKNSGAVLWRKGVTDQPLVPPVLNEGKIYSLTTNGTGTQINLTAYDVQTQMQVWQKPVAAGFLMSLPPEMMLRGDTLLVGSFTNAITLVNKNTGVLYWSKGLNTKQSFLTNDEIVYNDQDCGCVKKISLENGATSFEGQPIPSG